jgi:hypothetical protein
MIIKSAHKTKPLMMRGKLTEKTCVIDLLKLHGNLPVFHDLNHNKKVPIFLRGLKTNNHENSIKHENQYKYIDLFYLIS